MERINHLVSSELKHPISPKVNLPRLDTRPCPKCAANYYHSDLFNLPWLGQCPFDRLYIIIVLYCISSLMNTELLMYSKDDHRRRHAIVRTVMRTLKTMLGGCVYGLWGLKE